MNTLGIIGVVVFIAGIVLLATGKAPLLGVIVAIVGGILARTGIKDVLGQKMRDQKRDQGPTDTP